MRTHPNREPAFIFPTLIMITLVLMILATALLTAGTSGLRVATHDQQSNQALYAAEAGLARASAIFAATGSLPKNFKGDLGSDDSAYAVTAYRNDSDVALPVPGGPVIPPSTVYLHSVGTSENGTRRAAGALFSIGLKAFKVGALGAKIEVTNSTFDAYNSSEGEYDSENLKNDLPLLASNTNSGPTFEFVKSHIKGDVFVGSEGNPDEQITADEESELANTNKLDSEIKVAKVLVPELAPGEGTMGNIDFSGYNIGPLEVIEVNGDTVTFDDGTGLNFNIDITEINPDNPADCFSGSAQIFSSHDLINGEWLRSVTLKVENGHDLFLRSDGMAYYTYGGGVGGVGSVTIPYPEGNALAELVFGKAELPTDPGPSDEPPSVTNPTTLKPGHYDTITVKGNFDAMLSEEGTYVIKNLIIEEGSHLNLPDDGVGAKIYVTEKLAVRGDNAIANASRKPPKVKVFYTGDEPVDLSGGSKSYFTLVAPDADINLTSPFGSQATEFFGALVGKNVKVSNANFHFDTDTTGIGTGTMGTAVTFIQRHRL